MTAQIHIAVFQGIDGRWSYAPASWRDRFKLDEGEFDTSEDACAAAQADTTIPRDAIVTVNP